MRDIAIVSVWAGLAGAAVVNGVTLAERAAGLNTQTPWGVAADIFLVPAKAHTPAGTMLGLIASIVLSAGVAFLIHLFLKWSGMDYAPLKGLITALAIGFITMGFAAPLLKIAPGIRSDLVSNFAAFLNLSLLGLAEGYLVRRLNEAANPRKQ